MSSTYSDFAADHAPDLREMIDGCKPELFAVRLPGNRPAYHITVFPAEVYGKTYAAKTLCGIRLFKTAQAVTGGGIAPDDTTEPCPRCARFVLNSRPADFPAAFACMDNHSAS